ncbi:MAG: adenylosuccinate synthetase [Flavobacteriales bacterium]|uniref:adenylosuccinate synthetase n=1 Tax=Candidatus Ulvibacter alkanivorans TaxID=2267620 RepID=UPI000DF2DF2C|nr:adenylosuccinate synthetase [Candidatus Ulvibacter alkanivorans]MCH2489023.1 adenylosuccinate synthetase [Flavobacteriales bacterium]
MYLFFQIPKEVPHPDNNTPIDLTSWPDLIIYVIIPIVIVILFFIWRKRRMKNRD